MPRTPVIRLPMRKLMAFGIAFEKSYEGDTVLAAMLTEIVATASVKRASPTTIRFENLLVRATGSQIAWPYTTTVAEVIRTASSGKKVMVVGSPKIWPSICCLWLAPNRVKSGMFRESVDQNAIIAMSEGKNNVQKGCPQPTLPLWLRIGPKPCAEISIQISRNTPTTSTNGAAQFSNRRRVFMPRRMIAIWMTQKIAKLSHSVPGYVLPRIVIEAAFVHESPNRTPASVNTAPPPIQLWMPN